MKYNTKHKKALIGFLAKNFNKHFTIEELKLETTKNDINIGQTTLYRLLDELVLDGKVKKYFIDNKRSACYQYVKKQEENDNHFHMICHKCQTLLHLDCNKMDFLVSHIYEEHNFFIDPSKIVLYGICDKCKKGNINEKSN